MILTFQGTSGANIQWSYCSSHSVPQWPEQITTNDQHQDSPHL